MMLPPTCKRAQWEPWIAMSLQITSPEHPYLAPPLPSLSLSLHSASPHHATLSHRSCLRHRTDPCQIQHFSSVLVSFLISSTLIFSSLYPLTISNLQQRTGIMFLTTGSPSSRPDPRIDSSFRFPSPPCVENGARWMGGE
jgi:hypothetical protein